MRIPDYVCYAMDKLISAGYECYLVGGCVRDALMGITPHDYDLTTSALPSEMQAVFKNDRVIETGIKHGTLTVLCDSNPIEITTYRIDGEYDDNRHPKSVSFSRNLRDDLSRRDFTVNAMAMSRNGETVDLFDGKRDIENGVIRCVGEPSLRFGEDGLRIMRALRFSATLGFSVDDATASAIDNMSELLCGISAERIAVELKKLICGSHADCVFARFASALHTVLPEIPLERIAEYAKLIPDGYLSPYIRLAVLFSLAEHPIDACDTASKRLKLSKKEREQIHCCTVIISDKPSLAPVIASLTAKLGYDLALAAYTVADCKDSADCIRKLLKLNIPLSVDGLEINGNDVANLGVKGAQIGYLLKALHNAVLAGECQNNRESLLCLVDKLAKASL